MTKEAKETRDVSKDTVKHAKEQQKKAKPIVAAPKTTIKAKMPKMQKGGAGVQKNYKK
eukprot:CAMPEP_0113850308 /NCGR_PEP_ID=MMETSP0372-20130328/3781_1 /TAXON_ID=340204 /ORGANISM="Lankesteria abbotti" /LENGTH=57 /DNA_ID=CAMNT_0000820529 /DNA_START=182 /DNA_END=355 /DNA_ORIENTATION=- /assembly_acc=CAM_ASM_000359